MNLHLIIKESGRDAAGETPDRIADASASLMRCYLVCCPIWLSISREPEKIAGLVSAVGIEPTTY